MSPYIASSGDRRQDNAVSPVGQILPTELFGIIAESLYDQRYYRTCANLNVASGLLYDQTLKLLWTTVIFGTLCDVDVLEAESEMVARFHGILNAGGSKYIQYILDTNHPQQLGYTEEEAARYWRFVKNQLEDSIPRTKSLKAVVAPYGQRSVDAVRIVLLKGFVCGSGDMAMLAENLSALYATSSDYRKPWHLGILLDDCTQSRDAPTPDISKCLAPAPLKTKGVSISNMNQRTFGEATSRALFFDILKLLHRNMLDCKLSELFSQSASWLFARSFRTSDVKAMLYAHKEAIKYETRFAFCHLQFILCDLPVPRELEGIADSLLTTYMSSCEAWASVMPTLIPFCFLRLRRKSGVALLEVLYDPVEKAIVVLTSVGDHRTTARGVHPVASVGRERTNKEARGRRLERAI